MKANVSRQLPKINLAPLLLRDMEDLASQAKAYEGKNGEGLYARATVIIGVIVLDHFIDLYFDRITPESNKREIEREIVKWKRNRKVGTTIAAKWYVIVSHYTLSRFQTDRPPFSDLKKLVKLRNRLVHLYQKYVQSRSREGVPNLLREVNWKAAEKACETVKGMISAFYQEAGHIPPNWLYPETTKNGLARKTGSPDRARNVSETGGSHDGAAFSRRSAEKYAGNMGSRKYGVNGNMRKYGVRELFS